MFVVVLGHDLRNALNAIITSANLLQCISDDDAVRDRGAHTGERQAHERIIEDLLDLARARLAGGIPLNREWVDLGALVQRVVQEHHASFPRCCIELHCHGNLMGEWDADRLAQVASNLIGNSLQHGEDGGTVQVLLDGAHADMVVLSVANGGSIPAEVLPYVFDPFHVGQRQQGRTEGLGLGLYIVQQIVQAHQGSVDVQLGDAQRTLFRVKLPRRAVVSFNP